MSKEFLPETTTVTISQQHFGGETFISTSTVTGINIRDLVRAVRCATAGMEYADKTINEYLPK